jgi:serine protease
LPSHRRWVSRFTLGAAGLVLQLSASHAAVGSGTPSDAYHEGTLLVRFAPQTPEPSRLDRRKRLGAQKLHGFDRLVPGLEVWALPKHFTVKGALAALREERDLLYAEPDRILRVDATPNDPSLSSLWGLHNTGQGTATADADIDAPEAWNATVGSGAVVVGVVDTGIDYDHPDLAANVWVNPGEIPSNGLDDDANGFVDDVHGWNAAAKNGDPFDDHRHGTHVSGTIGAVGNNGVGVVGVAWNVKLMALKFLTSSGTGTTADAIQAIDYAVAQKRRGVNLRVLNSSWGGSEFSQALLDSINAASAADILFVAAAGNSALDIDGSSRYPAGYDVPNIVAVAATTNTDGLATFSNYGANTVDLGAPGESIVSTTPNGTYSALSGSSMAAPHVSGVAALMLSLHPDLPVDVLKAKLLETVDPLASLAGKTLTGGRLNAQRALAALGPALPTFHLTINPTTASLTQGNATPFTVEVTPTNGFTGEVTLSLASTPALVGATATFTPNPVAPGGSASLSVATSFNTATGTYQLTVTGLSGSLTRTASANLTVDPQGTTVVSYRNPTVIAIPDNNTTGITSTIDVPDALDVLGTSVGIDITHTYIGDLEIAVISPAGTRAVLHNRAGGPTDNLHQTFAVTAFNGQSARGTWRLTVRDLAAVDVGTLDGWTLTIKGDSGLAP